MASFRVISIALFLIAGKAFGIIYGPMATVAALKSQFTSTMPNGIVITVSGYRVPGDGGGDSFILNSTSTATDDGGSVIAPNSGPGRWIAQFPSGVNVRQFGAVGNLSTDDWVAVQSAVTYCVSTGQSLYLPPGTYWCNPTHGQMAALGPITITGAGPQSVLDGHGRTHAGFDISGGGLQFHSVLGATTYTFSGTVDAQAATFTMNSVAGLSVGQTVFIALGTAPSDSSLPYLEMFSAISGISGSSVTIADPVPENIIGTSHTLNVVTSLANGITFSNLGTNYFYLPFDKVQHVKISNLWINQAVANFVITNSVDVQMDHIYCNNSHVVMSVDNPGTPYGAFLEAWNDYGIYMHDVYVNQLSGVTFWGQEGQMRDCFLKNIHIGVDYGNLTGGTIQVFSAGGGVGATNGGALTYALPVTVEDLYVTSLDDGRKDFSYQFAYHNVYIMGQQANGTTPNCLFGVWTLSGDLRFGNVWYNNRRPFRYIVNISPSSSNVVEIQSQGILSQMRVTPVTTGSASHITSLTVSSNGAATVNYASSLSAGKVSILPDATVLADGAVNYSANAPAPNPVYLNWTTDGSLAAGSYFIVEGETLLPNVSPGLIFTSPDPSPVIFGSGAPSPQASFFGQQYFDYTNNRLYTATNFRGSSADWLLVTSAPLRAGSATLSSGSATVSDAAVTSSTIINLKYVTPGGTPGAAYVFSKTASTGFTIKSTSGSDSSIIYYEEF